MHGRRDDHTQEETAELEPALRSGPLRNQAREENAVVARVERRLAAVIIAEMLSRVDAEMEGPPLLIKGGSALELRLGLRASRVSADLDAIVRMAMEEFMAKADAALRVPLCGFVGRVEKATTIKVPGLAVMPRQFKVPLTFQGRSFKTITVELSAPEGQAAESFDLVAAPSMDILGMEDLPDVPCLTVRYQVAQKFHACTDPLSGDAVNTRARDLVDLLLLRSLTDDLGATRQACEEIFAVRARQAWPPLVVVPEFWRDVYALAAEALTDLVPGDVETAAGLVREFIAEVAEAPLPPNPVQVGQHSAFGGPPTAL